MSIPAGNEPRCYQDSRRPTSGKRRALPAALRAQDKCCQVANLLNRIWDQSRPISATKPWRAPTRLNSSILGLASREQPGSKSSREHFLAGPGQSVPVSARRKEATQRLLLASCREKDKERV